MGDEHDPTADPDVERWWQWGLVWIAGIVLGGNAGASHGFVGALGGIFAATVVVFLAFLAVRLLSLAMAPEGSVQIPPKCLHDRCEGLASVATPGRYDFVHRDGSGDTYRCHCGDRYLLTPDTQFGASTMFLLTDGSKIPFKRKRILGPWRSFMSHDTRRRLQAEAPDRTHEATDVR